MKIILLEKVEKLGNKGDIVEVSDGYARNYLIPKKLALAATPSNLKAWEAQQKLLKSKEEKRKAKAEKLARRINKTTVTIEAKVGEEGKLFGAVSSIDILNALREKGITEIEKGMIKLDESIRQTGNYKVKIKLHPEVEASLKVVVTAKE